ncbi:MAG: hypothetical protein R3178_01525 [Rhodothermales bacterium]|nr:hypothetical protein [Rhodothermales bacterium]
MKTIGILRGMETTFPDALVAHINKVHASDGVQAEFVLIDAVTMDDEVRYDVILDRISHEVPFYRSYLKWASLRGTFVVNNPFWWSADDKFIDNVIARQVGVAVPKSVILPHRNHPPNTDANSFRNLRYPIDWERIAEYVGFPAFLKPHDGGGWRGVTKVHTLEELWSAYNESGTDCMMLQEGIEYDAYFRCYGIGREHVRVMKYNPAAPGPMRYKDVPEEAVPADLMDQLETAVLSICKALGYDMNTVELAMRGGTPYAIDFMNPAPDADYHSVGDGNFEWVVRTTAEFLVRCAKKERKAAQFTANGALEPGTTS